MGLGFEMAGFEIPLANEIDEWAADSYEANHPNTRLVRGDVRMIGDWLELLHGVGQIDGVIGGAPCQSFSMSGRRDPHDPRNSLFMEFAKCVGQVRPKFFVLENVSGILSMRTASGELVVDVIVSTFDDLGYEVRLELLNAADCGVPQNRHRVFFVGLRNDVPSIGTLSFAKALGAPISINMAISDLPQVAAGEGTEEQDYPIPPQNAYQEWVRSGSPVVRNHVAMRHTRRIVERFKVIAQGQSVADVPPEHSAAKRGDPSVKSGKVFGQNNVRPWGDRPCPTVPASFQSNFVHPHLHRNFTAREGARLQSFPDTYVFKGARTTMSWEKRLSQYKQIGNAVPPLMAKAVGLAVLGMLGVETAPPSLAPVTSDDVSAVSPRALQAPLTKCLSKTCAPRSVERRPGSTVPTNVGQYGDDGRTRGRGRKPFAETCAPWSVKGKQTMKNPTTQPDNITPEGSNDEPINQETADAPVDGKAEAIVHTPEEVEAQTNQTADRLLALGGGEATDKIERGRIIDEYVRWLQRDGKHTSPNPFKLLAECKVLPWQKSQIRGYRDAYLLWEQLGGETGAPKVDVTSIGMVLSLKFEDAKKILDLAAKKGLSTRKVAELVKKAKGNKAAKPERIAGDWKALSRALDALEHEAALMLECPSEAPADGDVIDRIEVIVKSLQAIVGKATTPPVEGDAL